MPAPELVLELVERFRRNEAAYRSGQYNETQVRREFIDPFFECLGWDVNNRLAILNSSTAFFMFRLILPKLRGDFYEPSYGLLQNIPYPVLDLANKTDKYRHDRITALVERILTLNQQRAAATSTHERTILDRQITATDRQIDHLVHALYGLTDTEITLVEGTSQ